MKKHSKKEEVNLDELEDITQQNLDLSLSYESIFKSDKKDELLKDLMKVNLSKLDKRWHNSSDAKMHKHKNTDENNNENEFPRVKRRNEFGLETANAKFVDDPDGNLFKDNTEVNLRDYSKSNRRDFFEETIKENFDNRDQNGSSLLADAEKIKKFNDLNYEVFDFQTLKSKIRKQGLAIAQSNEIEHARDSLKKIYKIWDDFQENLSIAKLRSVSESGSSINYSSEYETRLASFSEIRKEVYKATIGLLDKDFLPELVEENGKLFFYELNAFNFIYNVQNKESRSKLDELEKEFIDYLNDPEFNNITNKFVDLAITRNNFARNMGFKDYFDYFKILNLKFDQNKNSLKELLSNIKSYILPIYKFYVDNILAEFSKENENMRSDFYVDMDHDEFAEYYKNIFGDFDWELRNLNDAFTYINENRVQQKFFPESELASTNLKGKKFLDALFYVSNRAIDRQSRGYLETLADLGYINLSSSYSIDNEDKFLGTLPDSKLFCMNLSLNNSMRSISNFIYLSGKAYSELLRYSNKSNTYLNIEATIESQHFIGTTMEMMTISRLNTLFDEDNARKFRYWRIKMLLFHIVNKCFLFEFELQFYELLDDVMDTPFIDETEHRLILDMLEKRTGEIWEGLLKEYRLTHYYQDKEFRNKNVRKYLIENPFTGLDLAYAELASIFIMLEFQEDRAKARYDLEKFCVVSGQSLFEEELALAGIENPKNIENLKYLAFAIAETLETLEILEIEESDYKQ